MGGRSHPHIVENSEQKTNDEEKLISSDLATPTAVTENIHDYAVGRKKSYAEAVKVQNRAVLNLRHKALVSQGLKPKA